MGTRKGSRRPAWDVRAGCGWTASPTVLRYMCGAAFGWRELSKRFPSIPPRAAVRSRDPLWRSAHQCPGCRPKALREADIAALTKATHMVAARLLIVSRESVSSSTEQRRWLSAKLLRATRAAAIRSSGRQIIAPWELVLPRIAWLVGSELVVQRNAIDSEKFPSVLACFCLRRRVA